MAAWIGGVLLVGGVIAVGGAAIVHADPGIAYPLLAVVLVAWGAAFLSLRGARTAPFDDPSVRAGLRWCFVATFAGVGATILTWWNASYEGIAFLIFYPWLGLVVATGTAAISGVAMLAIALSQHPGRPQTVGRFLVLAWAVSVAGVMVLLPSVLAGAWAVGTALFAIALGWGVRGPGMAGLVVPVASVVVILAVVAGGSGALDAAWVAGTVVLVIALTLRGGEPRTLGLFLAVALILAVAGVAVEADAGDRSRAVIEYVVGASLLLGLAGIGSLAILSDRPRVSRADT